jgi:peptide/nickel transport system substrate-binding protein
MRRIPGYLIKPILTTLLFVLSLAVLACSPSSTPNTTPTSDSASIQTSRADATVVPTQASGGEPVLLRVGAVADTYRNDSKDLSQLTVGMFPTNANIFDQLSLVDPDFQLQPMLAESWEYIEQAGAWRFHLRKDAKFHDGQPFTAQAVAEMVQRFWSQGEGGDRLQINQNSAVAVDNFTIDITPVSPHLRLPEELAHSSYGIRAPGSDPLKGEHIGTGPFKFLEYIRDNHITVEKSPNYWGQAPQVQQIAFRFMPDPNTRILALQAGEVDVIYDVPPEATSVLEGNSDIQVLPTDVSASQYLMVLLTGKEPYDLAQDIKVREAIGYAIDRQAIVDISFNGFAANSQHFGPVGVLGQYADRIVGYRYDPDQAKSLLTEAGWKDSDGDGVREKAGRRLSLELINGFPAGPENGQTAEVVQEQLRAVGIDVRVANMPDNASYDARLENGEGDLFLEIGNQNSPSPCFLASLFYGRYESPGPYARGFAPGPLGWPEYDDEIDACNSAATTDEAAMHRANAIHILVDEARPLIPLVGITRIYAARTEVKNFNPHPVRLHVRWDSLSVTR